MVPESDQVVLRKRLLQRMMPLVAARRGGDAKPGIHSFGPQLFSYCAFNIERLASVRLPHPSIAIVLSGCKEIWLGDAGRRMQPGEVCVFPGNLDLDVVNIPDERSGLYESLLLEVAELPAPLIRLSSTASAASAGFEIRVPLTGDLIDALEHAAITLADTTHAKALAEHRLAEVLMLLQKVPAARPLFASNLADRVGWLILGAPSRDWTAAAISRELGVGESTLRRHLATEGHSLRQIITDCRMGLARDLLMTGRGNVAQAAEAAGYTSRSHFAQRFRRCFGVPPGRMRGASLERPAT